MGSGRHGGRASDARNIKFAGGRIAPAKPTKPSSSYQGQKPSGTKKPK